MSVEMVVKHTMEVKEKKKKVKFCVRKEDSVGCPKRAIS